MAKSELEKAKESARRARMSTAKLKDEMAAKVKGLQAKVRAAREEAEDVTLAAVGGFGVALLARAVAPWARTMLPEALADQAEGLVGAGLTFAAGRFAPALQLGAAGATASMVDIDSLRARVMAYMTKAEGAAPALALPAARPAMMGLRLPSPPMAAVGDVEPPRVALYSQAGELLDML